MPVQPYTLFTNKDLALVRRRIDAILAAWAEKWFIVTSSMPAIESIVNSFESPLSEPSPTETELMIERISENGVSRIIFGERLLQGMYARATGEHLAKISVKSHLSGLEGSLVRKMLEDLLASVDQGPLSDEQPAHFSRIFANSRAKGSGTIAICMADQGQEWLLYLPPNVVWALIGKPAGAKSTVRLASRKTLIGTGTLQITVTAGEAELRLIDLMDLKPGNVVRLNMRHDEPFALETKDDHQSICRAYLGIQDGNKAVELTN